jgi:tetratricopeptide (TPR) repeat protein
MACLGQHEESIHHSTTAHSQAPSNPDILLNLCSALHALDRHEEAIGNFQVVLAVHPDHPLANFGTGNCRFDLGQWKEAIKSYHRTYRAMPDSYDINMNHGKAYARY